MAQLAETRDVLEERSAGPGAALEVDDEFMAQLKEMRMRSKRKLEATMLRREVLLLGRSAARLISPCTETGRRMQQLAEKMRQSELEREETRDFLGERSAGPGAALS